MTGALPPPTRAKTLNSRRANKRAVEQRFGLEQGDGILHGVVSRLTWQKGMDIFVERWTQLVASARGSPSSAQARRHLEPAIQAAAERHRAASASCIGYDEGLSHLLQAGATPSWCRRASSPAA